MFLKYVDIIFKLTFKILSYFLYNIKFLIINIVFDKKSFDTNFKAKAN